METKELLGTLTTEIKSFKEKTNADLEEKGCMQRELADRLLTLEQSGDMPSQSIDSGQSRVNKDLDTYIRTSGETKGLSITGGDSGTNAVVPFVSSTLETLLREGNPFRDLITVVAINGNGSFEEVISSGAAGSIYIAEDAARPETANPVLNKITTDLMEIYSLQTLTQRLLSQSHLNLADWIQAEMAISIAETEADKFVTGSGAGVEPLGLNNQTYDLLTDKTRDFGTIQKIASGEAAVLTDTDVLKETLYSLKAGYRAHSTWVMSSLTALTISKMKDGQGNYIFNTSLTESEPDMLLGRPIKIVEAVDNIGAGALPIFLADWDQAFRFINNSETQIQADPFSNKPHVDFYNFFYSGFALRKSEAIKAVSIEA